MKIGFVLLEGWEKRIVKSRLRGNSLVFLDEPLSLNNVGKLKDLEVLSIFIDAKIDQKLLAKMPRLKLLQTRSTGYDHIPIDVCKKKKIVVANIPSYGENTVAEHTFALILALSRKVHKSYLRTLRNDYSIDGLKGFDLKGKTIGVVGAGNIGKHVIRIARGFEMKVLVNDRHPDEFLAEEMNFKYTSMKDLLKDSDIISLHIPYTKENHHFIDKKFLGKMKKGSILINTSRGGIVDTCALIDSLKKGHLGGAGLDVIEGEEYIREEKQLLHQKDKARVLEQVAKDHMLFNMDNVVFTPHIAFYSQEALDRIIDDTANTIKNFIGGKIDAKERVC